MIGGQDFEASDFSEPAGGWRWVTGEPWSYDRWSPSNPSDSNAGEDYLEIIPSEGWNDTRGMEPRVSSLKSQLVEHDNGVIDSCELKDNDCNGINDDCEPDCDQDGFIDECELDNDQDGIPDDCD